MILIFCQVMGIDGYWLILLLHVHLTTHILKSDTENYKQKVGGWVPRMKTSLCTIESALSRILISQQITKSGFGLTIYGSSRCTYMFSVLLKRCSTSDIT